jgi:hypothetical protein
VIVEIQTFRVVDEAAFLEADRAVQTGFYYQQPGLLRRTTARGSDGAGVVITLWTLASADEVPAGPDLAGVTEVSTTRYETLD